MPYKRSLLIGFVLIAVFLVISVLTFYMSLGPCSRGSFSCDNGTKCVLQREICDGRYQCQDKQDEEPFECGMYHGSTEFFVSLIPKDSKMREAESLLECALTDYPEDDCFCRYKTALICSYANLTEVPKVSSKVTSLMLISNRIRLTKTSFDGMDLKQQLHLKNNNISDLIPGIFRNQKSLLKLYLSNNRIRHILPGTFSGLTSLEWLRLENNQIESFPLSELEFMPNLKLLVLTHNFLKLENSTFPNLQKILEIYLDHNSIEEIGEDLFKNLNYLHYLSLNNNRIRYIHPKAFYGLTALRELRLSNNRIHSLDGNVFSTLRQMDALFLGFNDLKITKDLFYKSNLSYLNLDGIDVENINFNSINQISSLRAVSFKSFQYCSMVPMVKKCKPNSDGISSLEDLLTKPVLRYSTWIMAGATCIGNGLVLWGRFVSHDENQAVSIVIRNLAVADFLMGVYLSVIGIQDIRYRKKYHEVALEWIGSWSCVIAGVLAMVSSEVSLFILAFMSVERFLLIADPFGGNRRLNTQNVSVFLFTIWLFGTALAIVPLIHWRTSTHYYGSYSGTCFPLHLIERFGPGWQYSAFVFLGLNLILLVLIASLYTGLLISIWRTRRATPLAMLDCEFAIRFFFIVLTDAACWAPIMVIKIFVFFSYEISNDIYAWLVVFVLPLNSAINPLLYTFTTPKYRNQIFRRGWNKFTSRKDDQKVDGSANSNPSTSKWRY